VRSDAVTSWCTVTTPSAGAATILVVDDDPLNRRLLVRGLVREGHATLEAGDGYAR
jgi:PleD family two-component response regulator